MTTLDPYFGTRTGELKIYMGFFEVGSGRFKAFTSLQAEFMGSYTVLGYSGTVAIALKLGGRKRASASGPCRLSLNDRTDDAARYQVNGEKLRLVTELNESPIDIYVHRGGTQIDNVLGYNLWIGKAI